MALQKGHLLLVNDNTTTYKMTVEHLESFIFNNIISGGNNNQGKLVLDNLGDVTTTGVTAGAGLFLLSDGANSYKPVDFEANVNNVVKLKLQIKFQ